MKLLIVDEYSDLERIDKYLMSHTEFSRTKIQKLIDSDAIKVNEKKIKNSYIVKAGDNIEINTLDDDIIDIKPVNIPLDIYYEDNDLLVVNKTSGMVVHPACGHYDDTLVNALLYHCNNLSTINGNVRPGLVHRIDKDTSGLLLIAKNDTTHIKLANDFKNKKVDRTYMTLVSGIINNDSGTIDAPIGRDGRDRKKMTVTDVNAKNAVTHFKVIEKLNDATLLECKLETGRTHQIRAHMKYINHPIINDPLYGFKKTIDNTGQLLHAKKLGFTHPTTLKYMEFDSPLPDKFVKIMDQFKIK